MIPKIIEEKDALIKAWCERAVERNLKVIEMMKINESLLVRLSRMHSALEAIKNAPGGGPSKRIAIQALEGE